MVLSENVTQNGNVYSVRTPAIADPCDWKLECVRVARTCAVGHLLNRDA